MGQSSEKLPVVSGCKVGEVFRPVVHVLFASVVLVEKGNNMPCGRRLLLAGCYGPTAWVSRSAIKVFIRGLWGMGMKFRTPNILTLGWSVLTALLQDFSASTRAQLKDQL